LRSDRFQSAVGGAEPELGQHAAQRGSGATRVIGPVVSGWRRTLVLSRLVVGLALIAGGVVWAVARGLHFYGLSLADIGYDLDQPPLLLVFVGAWLSYRSRRR
jgi:hypothetical protein